MDRIAPDDTAALADILANMPVSTIAGLLTPHGNWRDRAARMIAEEIVARLRPECARDVNQMILPI
jgi:hypothetical protein